MMTEAIKPRRWWHRVRPSVRSLIGLVLMTGAVLGWIIRVHRDECTAADAIRRADGYADKDWHFLSPDGTSDSRPSWRKWLNDRLGADYFQHIVGVILREVKSDADLAPIASLGRLESLTVWEGPTSATWASRPWED